MMEVIIVGSGISGVTLAITLSRYRNVKVTIFEKTTELRNVNTPSHAPPILFRCLSSPLFPP